MLLRDSLKDRRIIFVLGNLELGGAERQALLLAKHLVEGERAYVEVWGFNKSGPVATICEQHGIRWRVVPYPLKAGRAKRFASLLKAAWLLRAARPDAVLPYTLLPNVFCGLVWKLAGARLCVWNQRDEGLVPITRNWQRWAANLTSHVVSNSPGGVRFLVEQLNVSPAKVRIIQNGIEVSKPLLDRHTWRERLEVADDDFAACMVANLHHNKDHKTLLKAWREVVAQKPTAVLVLAGRQDGAYQSLVELANELGIEQSVRFAGHVSDVMGLLSAVDMGVFSSRSEGCPNGVLESMAAGLAVAGTDIDGIRQLTGPDFLAAPGDDRGLAQMILMLANDAGLRASVGTENRKRILERYDAQRMCEETASLLADWLHSGPTRAGEIPLPDLEELRVSSLKMYLKQRIFALVLIVACGAMVYYGWHRLWNEGVYSLKMAAFAPLGVVGGIFLLIFPSMGGKPNTTKEKVIVLVVFVIGLLAGLVNWFLMDPGFFGR